MRIAMIGQRGVPARAGGIEHHVEELGSRLAARGHTVVAWTRTNYGDPVRRETHLGMSIRHVPTIGTQKLDALVPSVLAAARSLRGFDVVHFHAIGPGIAAPLPRLASRALVVQTIHGLDQDRDKWGRGARMLLQAAAWLSARVPHETVVVSRALVEHYETTAGRATTYIPNGTTPPEQVSPGAALRSLGLERGRYALFVGRLVPEKRADLLVRAFRDVTADARLVIVGGTSFTDEYVAALQRLAAADDRIVLAGARYGAELAELYANAGVFVLPSALEGLPLVLLEAAGAGLPVVASDIAPHQEVLGCSAQGHRLVAVDDAEALAAAIDEALAGGAGIADGAARLRARVLAAYSWDAAADALEQLYIDGVSRLRSGRTMPLGVGR